MTRLIAIGLVAGGALLMPGCSGGELPSPTDQPATVQDVIDRVRASEQRTSDQIRQLTLKCDELEKSVAAMKTNQAESDDATRRGLAEIKTRLDKFGEKLDQLPAATKLQMNVPFDIKGTLEESIAELSMFTGVPMRIEAADLAAARIPKIRYVELPHGHRAEQLLQRAISEANLDRTVSLDDPRQTLVYVVHDGGSRQQVIITTRQRAGQRGVLPPIFGAASK